MVKLILYILIIPITTWAVDSINLNSIFKKSKDNYYQARVVYMFIIMSLSYLIVNFVNDFFQTFS